MIVYFRVMRTKDPLKASQIRSQALELLAREGFDGFSMQKLARASHVSPATLYIHFKDREDLLFQLYKEQMEVFSEVVLDGFDPEDPLAKGLEIQWRNRIRFSREHPISWRFLDLVMHSPCHMDFSSRIQPLSFEAQDRFVKNAVKHGGMCDFSKHDPSGKFPFEIFWSLAYAPLYELLRFESRSIQHADAYPTKRFVFGPERFDLALRQVLRSLQP